MSRNKELPVYHIVSLPEEGVQGVVCPCDTNGCIFWKGKYHLMYLYQNEKLPNDGHSWRHLSSANLVDWTYHRAALAPAAGDPDIGVFSGNAFVNKDGVPMLCWFGIDAGVCVATAEDEDLLYWKKHPKNPVIPIPKEGSPGWGVYGVWDPYMWVEGDTYYCLLGGNSLPNKKDTLYLLKSTDLVDWTPLHPFYEHPDLTWTAEGEDCSCPDFFKLSDDRWGLMCISHKMGARCYIGKYEKEKFYPEQHIRMNWPGGQFFAPESLQDDKGRRIFWAWVTDPRIRPSQVKTGSGFQSLPRVLSLDKDGKVHITPAPELEVLRRNARRIESISVPADSEINLDMIKGDCLEIAAEIEPNDASEAGLMVRCSPDGTEETAIWYDPKAQKLKVDVSHSTLRKDVFYGETIFTGYNANEESVNERPVYVVEAPLALAPGEPLKLRVFMDKPILEVFANDRQCITQMVYPKNEDALLVKACSKGGAALVKSIEAWDMVPARFDEDRSIK